MKKIRIAALLLALFMTLTAVSFAGEGMFNKNERLLKAIEEGKAFEFEATAKLDAERLFNLLPVDETTKPMALGLINILGKLKLNGIAQGQEVELGIGTDKGEIVGFKGSVKNEGENLNVLVKTSLLDRQFSIKGLAKTASSEEAQKKYMEEVAKLMPEVVKSAKETLLANAKVTEGKVNVEGIGEFSKTIEGSFTFLQFVEFVYKFKDHPVLANVLNLPELTDENLKKDFQEFVLNYKLFDSEEQSYGLLEGQHKGALIHASFLTDKKDNLIKLSLLAASNNDESEIDVSSAMKAAQSGENNGTFLINAEIKQSEENDVANTTIKAQTFIEGVPVALEIKQSETLSGAYAVKASVAISVASSNPLLTLNFSLTESDKQLKPLEKAADAIELEPDNTAAQSNTELNNYLMENSAKIGEELMKKLQIALPDEYPMLMLIFGAVGVQESN